MKKLPAWVVHLCYAIATLGICWQLWRLRSTGVTFLTVTLILVASWCLTKLSYLVFPRPKRTVTITIVRAPKVLKDKWPG